MNRILNEVVSDSHTSQDVSSGNKGLRPAVFYWESRFGRWGTLRMKEYAFLHSIVLPFNYHRNANILHALPLEQRIEKAPLH